MDGLCTAVEKQVAKVCMEKAFRSLAMKACIAGGIQPSSPQGLPRSSAPRRRGVWFAEEEGKTDASSAISKVMANQPKKLPAPIQAIELDRR